MKRKRIIRTEEVVDFFCSNGIEKLKDTEILKIANRMIKKQNLQTDIDNKKLKIEYFDKLKIIEGLEDLQTWRNLKGHMKERLKQTEYWDIFRTRINNIFSAGDLQGRKSLSVGQFYRLEQDIYRIAEKYIYSHQLIIEKQL